MFDKAVSASRTYVIACRKLNGPGFYFRKFTLPPNKKQPNNADYAAWYFMNHLDLTAATGTCYTFEDFSNVSEAQEPFFDEDETYENLE